MYYQYEAVNDVFVKMEMTGVALEFAKVNLKACY